MALSNIGLSGQFDLKSSNGSCTFRVYWSETYDIAGNKSVISIDKVEIKSTAYVGQYWLNGTISVNGENVVSFNSSAGTHAVYIEANNTFYQVTGNVAPPWASAEVAHNYDGSKAVTIAVNVKGIPGGAVSDTESVTLTKIPRAATLTAQNGTLGTAQTLSVNLADSALKYRITYSCGTASGYVAGSSTAFSTASSLSWTPPLDLARQNTTDQSVAVTLTVTTYDSAGTEVGTSEKVISCAIPESVKPGCSLNVTDYMGYADEPDPDAYPVDPKKCGVYIRRLSRLSVVVTPSLAYGAEIVAYSTTANGSTYTEAEFVTDELKTAGTLTISATVTDSRGRTGTATKTITVLDYTAPAVTSLSAVRCDSDGEENENGNYIKVTFSAAVTPLTHPESLNNMNTAEYILNYKKSSAEEWHGIALDELYGVFTVSNYVVKSEDSNYTFLAETDSSYDIEVQVADISPFGELRQTTGPTAFALMHPHPSGTGMAFGKISEKENAFEFGRDVYIKGQRVRVKRCVVGQNASTSTNPWYKYASVQAEALNEDIRISLKVTFSYGTTTRFATLNANIRTANTNGANAVQRLEFESDTGLDLSNFVMAYSGTGADSVYELWVNLTSYRFCHIEVLSETSRMGFIDKWVLYDQISAGYADTPTSGYTQVQATRPYLLNSWPVGSVCIRYDTTSPATLYGGTWQRIEGRMLFGCATTGTVGATGSHTTGTGSSSLPYVNVAVWRRTA